MKRIYYDFICSSYSFWYSMFLFSVVFIGSFFLLAKNLLAAIIIMTISLAILCFHGERKRVIVTNKACIIFTTRLVPIFKSHRYYYYDQLDNIEYKKYFSIWKTLLPIVSINEYDYMIFLFRDNNKKREDIYSKRKKAMEAVEFMNQKIDQIRREKELKEKYGSKNEV